MKSVINDPAKQTCPTCGKSVANYLLTTTGCPHCVRSPPLTNKSPAVGRNYAAHMTAKRNRMNKRRARVK